MHSYGLNWNIRYYMFKDNGCHFLAIVLSYLLSEETSVVLGCK